MAAPSRHRTWLTSRTVGLQLSRGKKAYGAQGLIHPTPSWIRSGRAAASQAAAAPRGTQAPIQMASPPPQGVARWWVL